MQNSTSTNWVHFIAIFGLVLCMAGCGGGGSNAEAVDNNLAPAAITARTITLQDPDLAGVTTSYTFATTTYTSTRSDSGTYVYARASAKHQATLQLISSFSTTLNFQLTFTSATNGTYFDTNTSKTSTFSLP